MKPLVWTLFSCLLLSTSFAGKNGLQGPDYTIESSVMSSKLADGVSKFTFKSNALIGMAGSNIRFSINGEEESSVTLDDYLSFSIKVQPGTYTFEIFWNNQHQEIFIDNIDIDNQYHTKINLFFRNTTDQYILRKPVIYLYPEVETDVKVIVNPRVNFSFTYPIYSDGWAGVAHPNGDIEIDGKVYNYLFWEASKSISSDISGWETGFTVENQNIVDFLETQLDKFGFTSKEKADFITYWAPLMKRKKACVVHFEMNSDCDKFAELKITPKPENVNRFYMFWAPVNNINDFSYLRPQDVQPIKRLGFTVLEWGGAIVPSEPEWDIKP